MLGRRAAAAAHHARASSHEMGGIRRHVFRAGHVHAPAADIARHAGIRLGAQLLLRVRRHLLDRLENDLRADRAIEPDDVGAPCVQRTRDIFRCRAEWCEPIGADRHLRDDRNARIELARGANRLLDLVQVAEGLEEKDVDSAFAETLELLPEIGARLVEARGSVWLDTYA